MRVLARSSFERRSGCCGRCVVLAFLTGKVANIGGQRCTVLKDHVLEKKVSTNCVHRRLEAWSGYVGCPLPSFVVGFTESDKLKTTRSKRQGGVICTASKSPTYSAHSPHSPHSSHSPVYAPQSPEYAP